MGAQVPQIHFFYQDLKNEVLLNGSNLMQTVLQFYSTVLFKVSLYKQF